MHAPMSYQHGQETADLVSNITPSWVRSRINEPGLSVSIVDGVTTETVHRSERLAGTEINPHHGTGSVLSDARNANGMPVTEILPTTLLTVNGMQAPASFWEAEGWIHRDASGAYAETVGGPTAQAPEAQQTGNLFPLDEQSMQTVNDAIAEVPQHHFDELVSTGINVVTGRMDEERLVAKFSQVSGLSPDDSRARIESARQVYQAHADVALTKQFGIAEGDLQGFYLWAEQRHEQKLNEAVMRQVHTHDMSGYAALAKRYLSDTPPSVDALAAAGHPIRKHGSQPEVFIGGMWLTVSGAAKASLI